MGSGLFRFPLDRDPGFEWVFVGQRGHSCPRSAPDLPQAGAAAQLLLAPFPLSDAPRNVRAAPTDHAGPAPLLLDQDAAAAHRQRYRLIGLAAPVTDDRDETILRAAHETLTNPPDVAGKDLGRSDPVSRDARRLGIRKPVGTVRASVRLTSAHHSLASRFDPLRAYLLMSEPLRLNACAPYQPWEKCRRIRLRTFEHEVTNLAGCRSLPRPLIRLSSSRCASRSAHGSVKPGAPPASPRKSLLSGPE